MGKQGKPRVYIDRIRVNEGFLDGLDLALIEGLNVIIGARGTGKTSIIELIRYCLGIRGYTAESTQKSLDHALSILGSGQVTVSVEDPSFEELEIKRTGDDTEQQPLPFQTPIIFSQSEIESVGLQPSGRLRLLDAFIEGRGEIDSQESTAASLVRSLTAEAKELRREIEDLEQQISMAPQVDKEIQALVPSEQRLASISRESAAKTSKLNELTKLTAAQAVSLSYVERYRAKVVRWRSAIHEAIRSIPEKESTPAGTSDPLANIRQTEREAANALHLADQAIATIEKQVNQAQQEISGTRRTLEDQSRDLRQQIEGLQSGAGAIVRSGQQLRERKAQLEALKTVLEQRKKKLADLIARRDVALDQLDAARQLRFESRRAVAKQLSQKLGPRIRIDVERAGQYETYATAIAGILRGSGLRYNDLSQAIAAAVSPRELLDAAEAEDGDGIADAAGITLDRASRIISHIRASDLGELATILVEDDVLLRLLDGQDYKDFADLSTGQRCTVVLPIILEHDDRILVVDQPEDHIDNAFIVETLIKAISRPDRNGQIIFATHNANIPVLGNAARVIQMGSDGRRAYVEVCGPLEQANVVSAITAVMEGGAKAFQLRAEFYAKHRAR